MTIVQGEAEGSKKWFAVVEDGGCVSGGDTSFVPCKCKISIELCGVCSGTVCFIAQERESHLGPVKMFPASHYSQIYRIPSSGPDPVHQLRSLTYSTQGYLSVLDP